MKIIIGCNFLFDLPVANDAALDKNSGITNQFLHNQGRKHTSIHYLGPPIKTVCNTVKWHLLHCFYLFLPFEIEGGFIDRRRVGRYWPNNSQLFPPPLLEHLLRLSVQSHPLCNTPVVMGPQAAIDKQPQCKGTKKERQFLTLHLNMWFTLLWFQFILFVFTQ